MQYSQDKEKFLNKCLSRCLCIANKNKENYNTKEKEKKSHLCKDNIR